MTMPAELFAVKIRDPLRVPPHAIESEQAVLGGLMLDPAAFDRIADRLNEADFYRRDHALIFRAIGELHAKREAVDAVTMADWFDAQGIAELVGGSSYILKLANATPSARNITDYARIVRGKSVLRQAIDAATECAGAAFMPDADPAQVVDGAVRALMAIGRAKTDSEMTLREALGRLNTRMGKLHALGGGIPGIVSGIAELDQKLGGFQEGDLILIPARPSMGKTSMLGFSVAAAARAGIPVGLVSGEQPGEQIALRLVSAASKINAHNIRNADLQDHEWPKFTRAMTDLVSLPVWICDRSAPHIDEIKRLARKWKQQHGIRALYVDYAQRVEGTGRTRYEQVSHVARELKTLARDLGIPVIALAQVNRNVESRPDKRPGLSDIADSGELEKEADQVVMLYRDDYYHADSADKGIAELIVEKNRHGATGVIRVGWDAAHMDFFDLAHGREAKIVRDYESRWGDE